jgi:D-lactate dehydrogenase
LSSRQVKQLNFSLDNLIGMDLHGKTVGIIGTGRIGSVFAKIMHGFGCNLLAYDIHPNKLLVKNQLVYYTDLLTLCRESHIISLHTPLNNKTRYLISAPLIREMKRGVMLINTARGALVRTEDVLTFLDNGHIGCYGMDVYEREKGIFFYDHTGDQIHDPYLHSLLNNPNVLVTPHQAFATAEALQNIAKTTFENLDAWANGQLSGNELIALGEPISQA